MNCYAQLIDELTDATLYGEGSVTCFGKMREAATAIEALQARCVELEATKDGAYLERNRLVSLLSKVFPSGKKTTAIEGWSEDWHGCVYIDLPTGQASWHYHDSQAGLFEHLPEYPGGWDGHTTDEKYERIASFTRPVPAQPTARTYMDGYSDGKAWALDRTLTYAEIDALWVGERLTIPQFNVRRKIARAIEAKLKEGL